MKSDTRQFITDETGLTTVEYAVAGTRITVVLVAAFTMLGGGLQNAILGMSSAVTG
jgi:pilus assembly protein Flp/PilA